MRPRGLVPHRSGVAIAIVMALTILTMFCVGVFYFLVRGQTDNTTGQSREIQGTILGEGISNRIVAMVDQTAWWARFFRTAGGAPYVFTEKNCPVKVTGALAKSGDVTFVGSISDLARPQTYRIKLELVDGGTKTFMTWDKAYSRGTMSADGAESSDILLTHPEEGRSRIDDLLDDIKITARRNRDAQDTEESRAVTEAAMSLLQDCRAGINPARGILESDQ